MPTMRPGGEVWRSPSSEKLLRACWDFLPSSCKQSKLPAQTMDYRRGLSEQHDEFSSTLVPSVCWEVKFLLPGTSCAGFPVKKSAGLM